MDDLKSLSLLDFAALLRRQATAVWVACDEPVAHDLSASLNEASARLIDLNRRAYFAENPPQTIPEESTKTAVQLRKD